jgi:hypothetical protein
MVKHNDINQGTLPITVNNSTIEGNQYKNDRQSLPLAREIFNTFHSTLKVEKMKPW